jgi:hypothetical protein
VDLALLTLLHLLVFVYWLGGDLGVFYSSTILTNAQQSAAARVAAAQVLAQVDMAPRTAMILTLPTGLTLAALKGWLILGPVSLALIWMAGLIWLTLAWVLHLRHVGPTSIARRADLAIRWAVIAALAVLALDLWPNAPALPLFLKAKCAILAATILCGLLIRRALVRFGPAFSRLVQEGASTDVDAEISRALNESRPLVVTIWLLLLTAAFLGLAKPL